MMVASTAIKTIRIVPAARKDKQKVKSEAGNNALRRVYYLSVS